MKRVFWVLTLVLVLTQPAAAAENQGSLKIDLDTGELPVTNGAVTLYRRRGLSGSGLLRRGHRALSGRVVRQSGHVLFRTGRLRTGAIAGCGRSGGVFGIGGGAVLGAADGANRRLLSLPSLPAASSHQGAVGLEAKSRHFAYRFRLPPDSRFRQTYPGPLGCGLVRPGSGAVRLAEKTERLTKNAVIVARW